MSVYCIAEVLKTFMGTWKVSKRFEKFCAVTSTIISITCKKLTLTNFLETIFFQSSFVASDIKLNVHNASF